MATHKESASTPPMIFNDSFIADPYPVYARLHEAGPIHKVDTPEGTVVWLVTRYADVRDGLADQRLARHPRYDRSEYRGPRVPTAFIGALIGHDPPEHTRRRAMINHPFTPRHIERMRPRVQALVDELLDAVADDGRADLIESLAAPLPITIICDLLGVPPDARPDFRANSDAMIGSNPERAKHGTSQLMRYFADLMARKQAVPGDDLLTDLVCPRDEAKRLSEEEIIGMAFTLVVGGYDTTIGSIGNAILALLLSPDRLAELHANPALIGAAVEEFLRYDGSVHIPVRRFATEDVTIGEVTIPAGDTVLISLAAANRDPDRFDDPDNIDFFRTDNNHVSFGIGPHHCLGAELARIEMGVALETLLRRFPNLELAISPEQLRYRPFYRIRVLQTLPVTF